MDGLVGGQVDRFLGHPPVVFGLDRADLRFDLPEHARVESRLHAFLLTTKLPGPPQARAGPTARRIIGPSRAGLRAPFATPQMAPGGASPGPSRRGPARNQNPFRGSGSRAGRPRPGWQPPRG